MCQIYVKVIEDAEYSDLRPTFSPLFHVICLIYSNSKYYSTQARIIVILKVCCNSSYIHLRVADDCLKHETDSSTLKFLNLFKLFLI